MKKLFSLLIFVGVFALAGYLLFAADMTWDEKQQKIVPAAENTTEEQFELSFKVMIEDLPQAVVDKMKHKSILHRAVAEALEENGFDFNEEIRFEKYTEDKETGNMKIYLTFGKNNHRLVYNVVNKTPTTYEMTIITIEDIEE